MEALRKPWFLFPWLFKDYEENQFPIIRRKSHIWSNHDVSLLTGNIALLYTTNFILITKVRFQKCFFSHGIWLLGTFDVLYMSTINDGFINNTKYSITHNNNNRGQVFVMKTILCQQLDITCHLSRFIILQNYYWYILDNLWLFN